MRSMLGAHSEIAAPPAQHVLKTFHKRIFRYGNFTESIWERIIEDVLGYVNLKNTRFSWDLEIDANSVEKRLRGRGLPAILAAIYEVYATETKARAWVCKENDVADFGNSLLRLNEEFRFIYLIRDGRDVAVSEKAIKKRRKHIYTSARRWYNEQVEAMRFFQENKENVLPVKYEELLQSPERTCRLICEFLSINFENGMLEFHNKKYTAKQAKQNPLWTNIEKPILQDNFGKYQTQLSSKKIKIFEAINHEILSLFGYSLDNTEKIKLSPKSKFLFESWTKLLGLYYGRNKIDKKNRAQQREYLKQIDSQFSKFASAIK